ncbi:phage protein [Pandoraea sputorum]|uniref:Protein of uncharacterized function (DUF3277) n=1 Tax=Pandoraea sputorum TaxID=93222 RepID=A0A239SFU9_9BURK|nr:phage protein [Pandoraea sputorum]AJC16810.1 hypothetical protein NA29_13805 [Pandoraea sputorum]SNU84280.1 Protein of uncharacterised function (DUF3277) [Pandoraea sputorum]VVD90288.1 hypothetical protein PSP20601_01581 [Pandoraea sputorum]
MATYSFQDVQASIVGPGAAFSIGAGSATSEEGISIETGGGKNTMTVGSDGEVMHSLHADKSGTIKVTLLKTSPLNALLQAAFDVQTLSSALHGKNIITVSNAASSDLHVGRDCAFAQKPNVVYDKAGAKMEWTFNAGKIDSILGTY